jgi:voltage-gated potassium channel
VIDLDEERLTSCDAPFVVGDATDDDVLSSAGIERASSLVAAVDSDAANSFITLTARALRPGLFIVARARSLASEDKLRRSGADRVVNPQNIGGSRMAAFVLRPNVAEFLDSVMHEHNLEFHLEELTITESSPFAGRSLRDTHIRDRCGALVLALRETSGEFVSNPPPEHPIDAGQVLIAIGTPAELGMLVELAAG